MGVFDGIKRQMRAVGGKFSNLKKALDEQRALERDMKAGLLDEFTATKRMLSGIRPLAQMQGRTDLLAIYDVLDAACDAKDEPTRALLVEKINSQQFLPVSQFYGAFKLASRREILGVLDRFAPERAAKLREEWNMPK